MKIKVFYTVEKEIEINYSTSESMEDAESCERVCKDIERVISAKEGGLYTHVTAIEVSKDGYMIYEE